MKLTCFKCDYTEIPKTVYRTVKPKNNSIFWHCSKCGAKNETSEAEAMGGDPPKGDADKDFKWSEDFTFGGNMEYQLDDQNEGEEWKRPAKAEDLRMANIRVNIQAEIAYSEREVQHIVNLKAHSSEFQVALDPAETDGVERVYIDCIGCGGRFLLVMRYQEDTNDVQALLGCPFCDAYKSQPNAVFRCEKH